MTRYQLIPWPPSAGARTCAGYEVECQEPATYAIGVAGAERPLFCAPITCFCDSCAKRVAQRGDIAAPAD